MATYKFSGEVRDARDTQLWKEQLRKERYIQKCHKDFHENVDVIRTQKSGAFGRSFSNDQTIEFVKNNKLRETQASGNFYNTGYLKDAVNHYSDPPYVTIKPGYRPGMPAPTDNQV